MWLNDYVFKLMIALVWIIFIKSQYFPHEIETEFSNEICWYIYKHFATFFIKNLIESSKKTEVCISKKMKSNIQCFLLVVALLTIDMPAVNSSSPSISTAEKSHEIVERANDNAPCKPGTKPDGHDCVPTFPGKQG